MNLYKKIKFENIGYYLYYMIDNKYIGSIVIEKPDRKQFGYYGRKHHTATKDIIIKNKKIKKGQRYTTYLNQLCGKSNFYEKIIQR